MADTQQEILNTAIKLEEDGKAFYLEVAGKTKNALVKGMFESLAKDEEKHVVWLGELAEADVDLTAHSKSLYEQLKKIYADAPEEVKAAAEQSADDIEAAEKAMEMERQAVENYKNWAETCEDQAAKDLCLKLSDFELYHFKALQNAIQYLQNPQEWFVEEEAWIFDGGTATT